MTDMTNRATLLHIVVQSCTVCYLVWSIPLSYAGEMKKDTSVNIRLTTELRAQLQRLAEADDRKLSAYVELVLKEHVRAQLGSNATTEKPKKR